MANQSNAPPWWVRNPWAFIALVLLAGGAVPVGTRFVAPLNPNIPGQQVATAAQNTATAATNTVGVVSQIYEEVRGLREQVSEQTKAVNRMDQKLGDLKSYVDIVERELRARDAEMNGALRDEIMRMFDELRNEIDRTP